MIVCVYICPLPIELKLEALEDSHRVIYFLLAPYSRVRSRKYSAGALSMGSEVRKDLFSNTSSAVYYLSDSPQCTKPLWAFISLSLQ